MTRCDLKWCPSCQRALAARTAQRYVALAADMQWPLVTTWTVQHTEADPVTLIRDVRRAHTRMRRLRWWRGAVRGGVVAYEITRGEHGWHPHGHALVDCRWLAVRTTAPPVGATREDWAARGKASATELAEQWSLCLRRRGSVRIRRAWTGDGGIDGAVREILKYSVKGSDLLEMAGSAPIGPLIDVLSRTRLVASWGTLYRHTSLKRTRAEPAMCRCGCTEWLPYDVAERRLWREHRLYR